MSRTVRLVIFDVDGTLVDSQADILASMAAAFGQAGREPPGRKDILGIVGLSLPQAIATLAPDLGRADVERMVAAYKAHYLGLNTGAAVTASSPLYPGVREMLDGLCARDDLLLGVATGKSRRGLDKLLDGHGLRGHFQTAQVADFHPSKPHPSMLLTALAETGIAARDAVMIGDTSFDMEMARAAGIAGIGVSWGYHDRARLDAAHAILDDIADLPTTLARIWETAA